MGDGLLLLGLLPATLTSIAAGAVLAEGGVGSLSSLLPADVVPAVAPPHATSDPDSLRSVEVMVRVGALEPAMPASAMR